MRTQRAMISCILDLPLKLTRLTPEEEENIPCQNHFALRRIDTGALVATIHEDHLFDRDGMRFDLDVEG